MTTVTDSDIFRSKVKVIDSVQALIQPVESSRSQSMLLERKKVNGQG